MVLGITPSTKFVYSLMGWQYATPPFYPKTERRTEHYANQS